MKYAIIAAGEGSRLAAEGISEPKPLVQVGGEYLIDRLIRIFMNHDAEEIVCVCNDLSGQVAAHLSAIQRDGLNGRRVPLRFVAKRTPSSMHSFFEISRYLLDVPFILTTVDTVFPEQEFTRYVEAFIHCPYDGLMGVTGYVDDERPLWVEVDRHQQVTGFYDEQHNCHLVSAGIYGLKPSAIFTLNNCIARGDRRMRNFQRALLYEGRHLQAWTFTKVVDIDHAKDIRQAEQLT